MLTIEQAEAKIRDLKIDDPIYDGLSRAVESAKQSRNLFSWIRIITSVGNKNPAIAVKLDELHKLPGTKIESWKDEGSGSKSILHGSVKYAGLGPDLIP